MMSQDESSKIIKEINGFCPICEAPARFVAKDSWYRGSLICQSCTNGSVPRERALAFVLNRERPNWRSLSIHESSPASRGISVKLQNQCQNYIGSHFFSGAKLGEMVDGFRNENLEQQTFDSEHFDIVITLDVFEHVWRPGDMTKEVYRTLRRGGVYISTFPIRRYQADAMEQRAILHTDGKIEHLKPEEIHGNPISGDGALVTWDYGYDIHKMLAHWAPFEVEICRFGSERMGVIGEYTDVIVCRKL